MISLPFHAIKLFFTRPKLFALGVFPGVITFASASVVVYLTWQSLLQASALWISLPAMMLVFLLTWLVFGKLSLLPVEDPIIDEVQRAVYGEVKIPAPDFGMKRLAREFFHSLLVAAAALFLLALSLIPLLAPVQFILIAWLAAYSFLCAIYGRFDQRLSFRVRLFFKNPVSNFFLGLLLNLLLFIPVINVFLLGFAQILSTLTFFHRRQLTKL